MATSFPPSNTSNLDSHISSIWSSSSTPLLCSTPNALSHVSGGGATEVEWILHRMSWWNSWPVLVKLVALYKIRTRAHFLIVLRHEANWLKWELGMHKKPYQGPGNVPTGFSMIGSNVMLDVPEEHQRDLGREIKVLEQKVKSLGSSIHTGENTKEQSQGPQAELSLAEALSLELLPVPETSPSEMQLPLSFPEDDQDAKLEMQDVPMQRHVASELEKTSLLGPPLTITSTPEPQLPSCPEEEQYHAEPELLRSQICDHGAVSLPAKHSLGDKKSAISVTMRPIAPPRVDRSSDRIKDPTALKLAKSYDHSYKVEPAKQPQCGATMQHGRGVGSSSESILIANNEAITERTVDQGMFTNENSSVPSDDNSSSTENVECSIHRAQNRSSRQESLRERFRTEEVGKGIPEAYVKGDGKCDDEYSGERLVHRRRSILPPPPQLKRSASA